jgi:hypothetical protein
MLKRVQHDEMILKQACPGDRRWFSMTFSSKVIADLIRNLFSSKVIPHLMRNLFMH